MGTAEERPARHDPSPDAGAHCHQQHVLASLARAEAELSPGRHIRIVVDERGHPEGETELLRQGELAPGDVRGESHDAAQVDHPCRAHADRADLGVTRHQLSSHRHDRLDRRFLAERWSGHESPVENPSAVSQVDDEAFDLGPPYVDPDGERVRHDGAQPTGAT